MSNEALVVVIVVLVLMGGAAFLGWRRRMSEREYLVADNRASFWPLMVSIVGTYLGGGMLMSVTAMGYEAGFVGVVLGLSFLFGLVLSGSFAKQFREVAVISEKACGGTTSTIMEVWKAAFGRKPYGVALFVVSLMFLFFLAAQFLALSTFLRFFFHASFAVSFIIVAAVLVVYTAVTGLTGVYWSDVVQVALVLLVGSAVLLPGVLGAPDFAEKMATLPTPYFSGTGYGIVFFVGAVVFVGPSVLVRLETWQRVISAKTDATARNAFVVAGLIMLFFFVLFTLIGMLTFAENPGLAAEEAVFVFCRSHLGGLGMTAALIMVLATVLSSADSLINVLAISIGRGLGVNGVKNADIARGNMTIRDIGRVSGIAACVSVIAIAFALLMPDIVRMMISATASLLLLLPITIGAVFAQRQSPSGAMCSLVLGIIPILAFGLIGPAVGYTAMARVSFVPGTVLAVAGYVLGYWWDRRNKNLLELTHRAAQ